MISITGGMREVRRGLSLHSLASLMSMRSLAFALRSIGRLRLDSIAC